MKYIFTPVFLMMLLSAFTIKVGIEDVIGAMKAGNATQLARFFDASVEISMPDKSNSYSKSQAEMIIRDFFSNNSVKNFEIIHKGESAGSQYCIGTLQTKSGAYRTTIFMKQKKETQVLQELRFETR
ncbi:MAG TPA: DUF4783 domain-containing protein [Ferruginibacter sp.]|nr:DUF4783 domain-containing protein [Ferruginibacter sp.]HMP19392.1 DUF4783 domain-containing protein [Ferruginibacter sp.]